MKNNRIVIVQCRLSSTRLPQKALYPLNDEPLLSWALKAMKKVEAKYYYVATDETSYDKLKDVCKENGFECFKGSAEDVLKRFCDLLDTLPDAETVIRATADNPFLFYEAAIDSVEDFEKLNEKEKTCDYLTYSGLPHGSGVEIFSATSLKKAITETTSPYDHEHVGPSLYKHQDKYVCKFVKAPKEYNYPSYVTTIDTYSDYLRALSVIKYINKPSPFICSDVVDAIQSDYVQNPVILVPSIKKGQGTGHLYRMLKLALSNGYFIYIPKDKTLEETDSLVEEFIKKGLNKKFIISSLPDSSYTPIFITDKFMMDERDYNELSVNKGIVSIDEGGEYSQYSDYLLDIIPSINNKKTINSVKPYFIEKSVNKKERVDFKENPDNVKNILICIGGEDPALFTSPIVKVVKEYFTKGNITAVSPLSSIEGVNVVKNIPNLKEKLYEYDLVITHYGLTAFEAVSANCAVILLPTTPLHLELAKKYGYSYIENKNFTTESIKKAFLSKNIYPKLSSNSSEKEGTEDETLSEFSEKFIHGRKMGCPICNCGKALGVNKDEVVSRNDTRTYRRCSKCGMVYMSYTIQKSMHYEKAYFFEEYQKQYGITYEEDFVNIKKQGLRRMENIKKLFKGGNVKGKTFFDIGCAYGPFLSAGKDMGMKPFGTDISEDAIEYVKEKLKFNAVEAAFPNIDTEKTFGQKEFDLVSMWYVIEHFNDLDSVLQKVSSLVKKGGVFAFSTPCGNGITCKSNKDHFYTISPSDHYSVWEIDKAKSILARYGFSLKKVVSTGVHPERFPIMKKAIGKIGFVKKIVASYGKALKKGDTVEFYCKKN